MPYEFYLSPMSLEKVTVAEFRGRFLAIDAMKPAPSGLDNEVCDAFAPFSIFEDQAEPSGCVAVSSVPYARFEDGYFTHRLKHLILVAMMTDSILSDGGGVIDPSDEGSMMDTFDRYAEASKKACEIFGVSGG